MKKYRIIRTHNEKPPWFKYTLQIKKWGFFWVNYKDKYGMEFVSDHSVGDLKARLDLSTDCEKRIVDVFTENEM